MESAHNVVERANAGLTFMLKYQSLLTKDSKTDLLTALLQEPEKRES